MDQILTFLLSAGAASIIAALIQAVMNRRKLSAEATEIITKAAAGTVENVMKDNAHLRAEVAEMKVRLGLFEKAQALHDTREREHLMAEERWEWHMKQCHGYSDRLAAKLRLLGQDVEEAPPVWPPKS